MFLAACSIVSAQVTTTVIIRTPTPASLAEWQRDRSIFQILIFNPAGGTEYRNARISFMIREAGGSKILAQSQDNNAAIPRFTIPAGASTVMRYGSDIFNEQAITIDQSLRSTIATTNSIPEGNYEFCVRIFDEKNNEIGASGELCRIFSVIIPDPPSLIQPADNEIIQAPSLPVFSWTPVLSIGKSIRYTLKITPVFDGQSPRTAIDNNPILFEKDGILGVSYQYTPIQPRFELYPNASSFAWQIQAVEANGKPAARNNGKSEIFTFKFGDNSVLDNGNNRIGSNDASDGNYSAENGGKSVAPDQKNNDRLSNGINTSKLSQIEIGQFVLNLDVPTACKGECALEGTGKIYLPLLRDSLAVRFAGLVIRRTVQGATVISGEAKTILPLSSKIRYGASVIEITSFTWNSVVANIEGKYTIDWSKLGLGGGFSSVQITNALIEPDKIPLQTINIALTRDGRDIGFGSCLSLSFDSIIYSAAADNNFTGRLSGDAIIPCMTSDGETLRGRFSLPLEKPDIANTLLTIQTPLKHVRTAHLPLELSAENFLIDLSPEANFSALSPSSSCLYSQSWSNPLWRGIIIPKGNISMATDDNQIMLPFSNAVLESADGNLALSVRAMNSQKQHIQLGGFGIIADTIALDICHQTLQNTVISGFVLIPETMKLTSSAENFDKLHVQLAADERWNWHGKVEAQSKARMTFGKYGKAVFSRGAITLPAIGKGILEWTEAEIFSSESEKPFSLAGLKFSSDGAPKFGNNNWKRLAPAQTTMLSGLPIAANEIGFGYEDNNWWFGASGTLNMPEESGLSSYGGIKIKRLKISGNDKVNLSSGDVFQTLNIGGNAEFSGNFHIGVIKGGDYGVIGRPEAVFQNVGNAKLPVDFAIGRADGRLFWHAVGAVVYSEPPKFAQSFTLLGGAFGAGWNVKLLGCDSSAVENSTFIATPLLEFAEKPLTMRAGLLISNPNHNFQFSATAECPNNAQSGAIVNSLNLSGNAMIYPEIGFVRGYLTGQISPPQAPLHLAGTASLTIAGTTFSDLDFSVESDLKIPLMRIKNINGNLPLYEKYTAGNKNTEAAAIQCNIANGLLTLSSDVAILTGDVKPILGIGGKNSKGSYGYIIAANNVSPCIQLQFNRDKNILVNEILFSTNWEGAAFAGIDALPCAGAISVSSAGDIAGKHREQNGVWTVHPKSNSYDCGAELLPVFARMSAALRLNYHAEIHEKSLQASESQEAVAIASQWNKHVEADAPQVKITSIYVDKTWSYEQNPPPPTICDERISAHNEKSGQCDVQAMIVGTRFSLRNAGNSIIAKGNRVKVNVKIIYGKKIREINTIIELKKDINQGGEYIIEGLSFRKISAHYSGAMMMASVLAPLSDTNLLNNCFATGLLSCP